jgi:hypothetical protein
MARVMDLMATRIVDSHRRVLELSVLALAVIWHVGNDLPMSLAGRPFYRSFAVVIVAWCLMTAIIGWAGWHLLTTSTAPMPGALPVAGAVQVVGAVVVAACPPERLVSMTNWAFGTVGWVTILVLVRERRLMAIAVLVGPIATLVAVLWQQAFDQLAAFVIAGYGVCALQIAVVAGARLVRTNAGIAMSQARVAAEREIDRICAEEAAEDRAQRYLTVRPTTRSLLAGLADGRLAPDRPEVREMCALEAATLRRLCLEGNDLLHPLQRELHLYADEARRRDVRVELQTAGEVGEVPDAVRAMLLEVARRGSGQARSVVRLTVLATAADLRLGGTADGPLPADAVAVSGPVRVKFGGGPDRCWWEATWNRQSESW